MDLDDVAANFDRATKHCDDLVKVHRGYGGSGSGRRAEEISLNRAVVVLAVASWQQLIQDLTLASIDLGAPAPGSSVSTQTYALVTGRTRVEVGAFNTPNAENSRKLLLATGFDPRPHWTWVQRAGRGLGSEIWTPHMADQRINEWLKLRHAIAHGHQHLPNVSALQVIRNHPRAVARARAAGRPVPPTPVDPTIWLNDAIACLAFFRRLADLTGNALATHLSTTWR